MTPTTLGLLAIVGSYLLGAIPCGFLVARAVMHDDIRNHGSGNIGATNVGRVMGWRWGSLVLLLDALKGAVPTYVLPRLALATGEYTFIQLSVACGVSAVLGHMFPVWLNFRGGKGVATALGVVVVLSPWASLVALLVFVIVLSSTRYMSLSSMTASIAFGITSLTLLWPTGLNGSNASLTAFSVLVPALIVFRHRANIGRLLRGEENPLTRSSKSTIDTKSDREPARSD
jgi:glycerol-3-phosphate acyltransferase PlsY